MWILIMLLFVLILFLIVLALYRLYSLNEMSKECDEKIKENNYRLHMVQEEKAKLATFKMIVENLVNGLRSDSEVREKIKELTKINCFH